jgi:hypothetical protein
MKIFAQVPSAGSLELHAVPQDNLRGELNLLSKYASAVEVGERK